MRISLKKEAFCSEPAICRIEAQKKAMKSVNLKGSIDWFVTAIVYDVLLCIMSDPDFPEGIRFRTLLHEKGFWGIIMIGMLIFFPIIFLNETIFYRDLYSHYLPNKQLLVDLVRNGELPLWNPFRNGGEPLLANPGNSAFYPSNLLYFIFAPVTALNLDAILHTILAALAAYALARELRFHPTTAFIVGVTYGYCGYSLSLITLLVRTLALPYVPLMILFWHRFHLRRKSKWLFYTVLCGTLQLFTGAVEWTAISLLTILGWSLLYPYSASLVRKAGSWVFLCLIIAGLGAIQVLPSLELIGTTNRQQGLHYDHFATWSMHPKRLPELIVPNFIGRVDSISGKTFWGGKIEDENAPFIISIYFGYLIVLFALWGGLIRTEDQRFPRSIRQFLLMLLVAGVILSMGRNVPGFLYLYKYVPFLNIFRFPVKFLMVSLLPVALLAGYASECYLRPSEREQTTSKKVYVLVWFLGLALLAIAIAFALSDGFSQRVQEFFFEQQPNPVISESLRQSLVETAAFAMVACLLISFRNVRRARWHHVLLAGTIALDLLLNGIHVNITAPKHLFTREPNLVSLVKKELGTGRLFRSPTNQAIQLRAPSDDYYWAVRWELEVMNRYLATFYKIPVFFSGNVHGMQQKKDFRIGNLIGALPFDRQLPILSACGVTLILTSQDQMSRPGLQEVARIHNMSNLVFHLYHNEKALPRIYLAKSAIPVSSEEEAFQVFSHPDFDPRRQLILQGDVVPHKSNGEGVFRLSTIENKTNHSSYSISSSEDGYLVFVENFYPGWKVYVDGTEVPVYPANYLFSAIHLKAGNHLVKREYSPRSLRIGFLISIVSAVLFTLILVRMRAARKTT